MSWSPVTDSGGGRPAGLDASGDGEPFRFDLGGVASPSSPQPAGRSDVLDDPFAALRMFSEDHSLPRRQATPVASTPAPTSGVPASESLPTRSPAPAPEPVREAAATRPYVTARRSVFDDASSPMVPALQAPTLPGTPVSFPSAPAGAVTPIQSAHAQTTQTAPAVGAPGLPSLPAATVSAAVPHYTPHFDETHASPVGDPRALKAAQARASRQQRKGGRLVLRSFLTILLLAGVLAGAWTYGHSYLFPAAWDPALAPLVDEIELRRGAEFDHTVELVRQPAAEYGATVQRVLVGDEWVARVPEWRALGIASGAPTAESMAAEFAAATGAIYDAENDRIYVAAEVDLATASGDLRVALETAYSAQRSATTPPLPASGGFVGVSSRAVIANRAVSSFVGDRFAATTPVAVPTVTAPAATVPTAASTPGESPPLVAPPVPLPLPLAYELAAPTLLGEPLIRKAGLDSATVGFDTALPVTIGDALDDLATPAAESTVLVGDRAIGESMSLGVDDWSLVWAARLPLPTVEGLVSVVKADSYRVVDRSGVICAIGMFETATIGDAGFVVAELANWVASSPPAAQAVVTQLGETTVQLVSCDPGADAAVTPQRAAVDALISRQVGRLAI